jgi:hypothetical protein
MRKMRTIAEGSEWDSSKTGLSPETFDDVFRFALFNISVDPLTNTTPFMDSNHRILRTSLPNVVEVWVYFRIEPDDNVCTLLWMECRGLRVG